MFQVIVTNAQTKNKTGQTESDFLDVRCSNVSAETLEAPTQERPLLFLYFDDVISVYCLVCDLSLLIGKGPDSL